MTEDRVVSGMRPTGALHLGHFHGALKNWVRLQSTHDCFFFVADWHALTTHYDDPRTIEQHVWDMVIDWLAAGVDPAQATLFIQSRVPEHAELHLLLSMITPLSWLERVPTYKDQQEKLAEKDLATYGFLGYPLLQSADILIYRANRVPVGEDQKQHVELTRDIAQKFNHDYKTDFFPLIHPLIQGPAARVMSLRDGTKKMSKSDPSDQSRINLNDDADTIALKVRRAKTDPEPLPSDSAGLEGRPEARNLVGIYAALLDIDHDGVLKDHGGKGFGDFKKSLADLLVDKLAPIAAETKRLIDDVAYVDATLKSGAERAAAIADPIVADVEKLVGFLRV